MSMLSYPLRCYTDGCAEIATFKIAARWSDGVTRELKTYALTCSVCLAEWFRRSCAKQAACRLAPGETLQSPDIFEMAHGSRDSQLACRDDLKQQLLSAVR